MVNNELEFNNSTFSNNSNTFSASVTNNLNDLEVSAQNTNLALASFVSDGNSSNNSSECKALSSENNGSKELLKEYNLSIVKHVFVRTWKTTWRVALSVFILNFLTFFF